MTWALDIQTLRVDSQGFSLLSVQAQEEKLWSTWKALLRYLRGKM
jgi:hypothetical protein